MIRNWVGFYTLSSREVLRFFAVWKQTIILGVVTTLLYILSHFQSFFTSSAKATEENTSNIIIEITRFIVIFIIMKFGGDHFFIK